MGRVIKFISVFLLSFLLAGCGKTNDDVITVDIGVVYDDALELMTAPLRQVEEKLAEWEEQHPEIEIEERERIRNDDFTHLAVMGAKHLPDVFITDCLSGRLLAKAGLVQEVGADDAGTFTYDGKVYAYPVFREAVSVVIYDPENWKEGDPAGYSNENGMGFSSDYLSAAVDPEWFSHMAAGDKEASFTDPEFVSVLETIKEMASEDTAYSSADALIQAFAGSDTPAVVLNGDNVYRLLQKTKEQNLELYDRMSFKTLNGESLPGGCQYGIFLNAGLEGKKLEACLELAEALGVGFEDEPEGTIDRLEGLKKITDQSPLTTQYFSGYFWKFAREECFSQLLNGDKTAEEYASILQNYYEQYYLNVEDYAAMLERYGK